MNDNKIVLAVEDSDEDFTAFKRIMKKLGFTYPVYRVCDGDEALDYLYRLGNYKDAKTSPRPSIIVIDLNLPGTDGREVIKKLKHDEKLKSIPIIVLTTSSNPKDIECCYYYGANSYLLKPMGIEDFQKTIEQLFLYWFESVVLPVTKL